MKKPKTVTPAQVAQPALWMRVRRLYAKERMGFHLSGRSAAKARAYGSWFVVDADGAVVRSARATGRPNETLAQLATRLGLVEPWERA